MSTKYFLVSYSSNWSDEMDIDGFCVMTEAGKKKYFEDFKKVFEVNGLYTFYVGTNEEIEYSNFADFKNDFTVEEISEEEAKVLDKLFQGSYAFVPDVQDALDNLEGESEGETEEEFDEEE